MVINYNTKSLDIIIQDIYVLTGISISVLDYNYNFITGTKKQKYCSLLQSIEGNEYCHLCDKKILDKCSITKKLESHICCSGLYDAAMPIMKDDTVVGFIIMGQVRSADSNDSPIYVPDTTPSIVKKFNKYYSEIPFISQERINALYDLLPHVLFNDAIHIIHNSIATEIMAYIDGNLEKNLNIEHLCSKFYVSKNHLYYVFRQSLNKTITEYINEKRISEAKTLLKKSEYPVYQIAEKVGIYNYTYFCKLFKKLTGTTPTEFRE